MTVPEVGCRWSTCSVSWMWKKEGSGKVADLEPRGKSESLLSFERFVDIQADIG